MSNNMRIVGGKIDPGKKIAFKGSSLQIITSLVFGKNEDIDFKTNPGDKDSVKVDVSFFPSDGSALSSKTIEGKNSQVIDRNELVFSLSNSELEGLTAGKEGILTIGVEGIPSVSIVRWGKSNLNDAAKDAVIAIAGRENLPIQVLKNVSTPSPLQRLFKGIVDGTNQISFDYYKPFIDQIFCQGLDQQEQIVADLQSRRALPFNDMEGYRVLKVATEAFLMLNSGVYCKLEQLGDGYDSNPAANSNRGLIDYLWKSRYLKSDKDKYDKEIKILPFLFLIRQKFGDIGITTSWIDNYIDSKLHQCNVNEADLKSECFGLMRQRLQYPLFLELLWSYWQEEGMLVQTMNAISLRFQNMKSGYRDPLAEMEISHLRPLNNILWGYIQDQQHLLSVKRRAYEYDHHYGITLQGKAVPTLNSADSRVRFIGAFHNLLNIAAKYYLDSANKLVEPDPFPILNALRDVHFIIAEGMHNQYGDLPTTARQEMLMQQWILAQPEFGQFLPGRSAIPFTEPWMDRVAAMNRLQGWTDTSPMHFDNLAKFGEQILLSIRFADWSDQSRSADEAALWVNYFRSQIQGYIHSYKAATGVDLNALQVGTEVDSQAPAVHLVKRAKVAQNGNIPQPRQNGVPVKRTIDKESY